MAADKSKGQKWDGKSRVSTDLYRKNFDEIFKKRVMEGEDPFMKEQDELKESYEQSLRNKKERTESEKSQEELEPIDKETEKFFDDIANNTPNDKQFNEDEFNGA